MVKIIFVGSGLIVEESTVREEGSFFTLYLPSLLNKHTSSYFDEDLIYQGK